MPTDADIKLSFEFFPPGNDGQERRLWRTVGCLETLKPLFFSMTYGALGSDRSKGYRILSRLCEESSVPVAAHLTCAGQTATELRREIDRFTTLGIQHIVALRGDSTETSSADEAEPVLKYAADLVHLLAEQPELEVSVAAYPEVHPEAVDAEADLQNLELKLTAGASRAITQFFYDPDVFLRFRDQLDSRGVSQQLVPGILPVHNIEKVISFSERCGAQVPQGLIDEFRVWSGDADATRELALAHGYSLCEKLKQEGVSAFHFYTLNNSDLSYEIARTLVPERASSIQAA